MKYARSGTLSYLIISMNKATFTNIRTLPFSISQVHRAWTTPELLATWWGPA